MSYIITIYCFDILWIVILGYNRNNSCFYSFWMCLQYSVLVVYWYTIKTISGFIPTLKRLRTSMEPISRAFYIEIVSAVPVRRLSASWGFWLFIACAASICVHSILHLWCFLFTSCNVIILDLFDGLFFFVLMWASKCTLPKLFQIFSEELNYICDRIKS